MEKHVSKILERKGFTVGSNKKGPEHYQEADRLYEQLSDLVNDQFKPWYCRQFHRIGRSRVLILAAQARADGSNAQRLFSYLLRKEQQ